jgi:hypothetical protein
MDSRSPKMFRKNNRVGWRGFDLSHLYLSGLLPLLLLLQACATGVQTAGKRAPIQNPFPYDWGFETRPNPRESVVLRTKKGDRSVEVELPGNPGAFSDFTVPVSPAFSDGHPLRGPAGYAPQTSDSNWREQKPTYSDREITSQFSKGPGTTQARRELEAELGVIPSEENTPFRESSYLAAIDQVKGLFRTGRYEAALLEVDELLKLYPTDPKLHQMRGTLLDRTGQSELAMRSWAEAIELDPNNLSLKKFVERKRANRAMTSRAPANTPETPLQTDKSQMSPSTIQEGVAP